MSNPITTRYPPGKKFNAMLQDFIAYNPDTGEFIWRKSPGQKIPAGTKAGHTTATNGTNHYVQIRLKGRMTFAHRIAFILMTGNPPKYFVDHIDGNGLNNKWSNLRDVTKAENQKNKKKVSFIKSGVMGVHEHSNTTKWRARIKVNRKEVHLGLYEDWFDALCARKSAEHKYGFHPNHGRAV